MSKKYPIIAITGSSGAGTTTVKRAFEHVFRREQINPEVVEGDSFHSLNRAAFREAVKKAETTGDQHFSHFGPKANLFAELEKLFRTYGETGKGKKRYYPPQRRGKRPRTTSASVPASRPASLPLGRHCHGHRSHVLRRPARRRVVTDKADVARWVDLLVGVVPIANLGGSRKSTAIPPNAVTRPKRWWTPSCGACRTT